ncbi:Mur ligase family protein [Sphingomonas desiccabilis]|uniref:Glutamate ligase n=1 Tax=Sphingomonas desiccabilis TaxID=429134 RepID=A0A4Q2IY28_9SPHN|nr:Mur ligase family protein [Sphingomonas desiccabilis]MBB3912738.1 UDP-N-acetylmuramoyl-tripeptide--D-alanyl-D-alanine ligase [Sphingomonas desiccabilis]RXZ35565.1 glutamate ligase [Sphingomonas desiccabilis]
MSSAEMMESLYWLMSTMVPAAEASLSPVTLFGAFGSGTRRARVLTARGESLDAAWSRLATEIETATAGAPPRWLRVERVDQVEPTSWTKLKASLRQTKRNYFRYGIALDAQFERAFLEQELNANAMLYGGNAIAHAVVNEGNFTIYARRKYGAATQIDFSDEQPVFLFTTQAVFADADGSCAILHDSGLERGRRQLDPLTPETIEALVRSGAGHLARQVGDDGRFVYGYHPCFDRKIDAYNALRHASSTYSMIEAWEMLRDPQLAAAIERALGHLVRELIRPATLADGSEAAFLVDVGDEIKLGGSAVAILALARHAQATGCRDHLALMEQLALGIRSTQDPATGAFAHVLHYPDLAVVQPFRTIYYEGEAAFALMRLHQLTGDPRWLAVVERAYDHFIAAEHWRHHDHWLGYCTNELTLVRPEERYFRFGIRNVAGYLDFVRDRITTFPTLLELMMAAHAMLSRIAELPEHRHLLAEVDIARFNEALEARARHLLNGHFWPELAMDFARPDRILGSFFIRHQGFRVRIDDVEHYLSGLVAYHHYRTQSQPLRPAPPVEGASGLWDRERLLTATGGSWLVPPPAAWSARGVCIHPPTYRPGQLAVVRSSDTGRGMRPAALARLSPPPAAVITDGDLEDVPPEMPLLRVADTSEAVLELGRAARRQMTAPVLAVTGSAGKTTAVAMLAHALEPFGPVGRSAHNANLPHGVAWNLASMPPQAKHVVLELAVGRMAQSARLARPDVAIFTTIAPAHLTNGSSVADVARTKSAIFLGMAPGGTAILNRDMDQWDIVHAAAQARQLRILHYGRSDDCEVRLLSYDGRTRTVDAVVFGRQIRFVLGASGEHMALNALATLAAVTALGHPIEPAIAALAGFRSLPGRGETLPLTIDGKRVTLIDDAYNANPASMVAALADLAERPGTRRVAVLGEMAELGEAEQALHRQLAGAVDPRIDRLHLLGPLWSEFWEDLPAPQRGCHAQTLPALRAVVRAELRDGDVILFKGSNSKGIHQIVDWLKAEANGAAPPASLLQTRAPRPAAPQSRLLFDCEGERMVISEQEEGAHHPAALAKLLTLCLVDERRRQLGTGGEELVTLSPAAAALDSRWRLNAGDRVSVSDLMAATAIVGANEAAHALAEWHSGSAEAFTRHMNERAQAIGMTSSRFASPSGLGTDQAITGADAIRLGIHVLKHAPEVHRLSARPWFEWKGATYPNTNRLIGTLAGVNGLRTGSVGARAHHLLLSATDPWGRHWIAAVLGAPTRAARDAAARELLSAALPPAGTEAAPSRAAPR